MWNSVRVKQYATAFSVAACFIVLVDSQWPNYDVIKTRLPGKCARGEFDCIIGPCVPSYKFNDGHSDCLDGSDEFCFAGQIRCGKYCVHISFAGECLANPNCDGSPSAPSFCESTSNRKPCSTV
ncbi:hypothetical protein L596_003805 [Steinernema carpocapsae]|uniref:Uncharacterized protein n=1 Tax=Steinernema carpocapsae TaxID=34508 RepID=A0A4U8UX30_STECR|nr:hypothetical protein L596_003805 [Steinernema carpocapsae]